MHFIFRGDDFLAKKPRQQGGAATEPLQITERKQARGDQNLKISDPESKYTRG
jgi:hypothetical protein